MELDGNFPEQWTLSIECVSLKTKQVVLAQDYHNLEYISRKFVQLYRKWGLEMKEKKKEKTCVEENNKV